jgi:hypothetical protein
LCGRAPNGRRHLNLTSKGSRTPLEVKMSYTLVSPDATVGRAHDPARALQCSGSDGGLDAAWVHLAGELDIATTPHEEGLVS